MSASARASRTMGSVAAKTWRTAPPKTISSGLKMFTRLATPLPSDRMHLLFSGFGLPATTDAADLADVEAAP